MIQKIKDGRTDLIFDLLEQDPLSNLSDESGIPLIRWCAYYGDVSAIKFLLSKRVPLSDLGENYDLNGAAFHGHWQLCQFLLEQGAKAGFQLQGTGETALHAALCKANRPTYNQIVKLLLAYGANPNCPTIPGKETGCFMRDVYTRGETPLHRAAAFGNVGAIQMLLEAGADKTLKDANGDTPLAWASWHRRPGKILSRLFYDQHAIHP